MITTRDLFNYFNPARTYTQFLEENNLKDGVLHKDLFPEYPIECLAYLISCGVKLPGQIVKGSDHE
jgi:hypothetical protein